MTAAELLTTLRQQGFRLAPLPGGKLEISPASRLPDPLKVELRQQKAAVLVLLTSARSYITAHGELGIPFDCDPKYHWWKPGGQSIAETLAELNAPSTVWQRYIAADTESRQ